jgi:hypothetical protein
MVHRTVATVLAAFALQAAAPAPCAPVPASFDARPLAFEVNRGQSDARVRFVARGAGQATFLTDDGAHIVVAGATDATSTSAVELRFDGGGSHQPPRGRSPLPGTTTYIRSDGDADHVFDAPTYRDVVYENVYPGVDAVFYGTQRALEYDLVVAPRANPRQIALKFAGARAVEIDAQGGLVLRVQDRTLSFRRPVGYQVVGGARRSVEVRYALRGADRVGFHVGRYDARHPLVIDPVLALSSNLWGVTGVAVDPAGNIFVAGSVSTADLPVAGGYQTQQAGTADAYVMKLDLTGTTALYTTYLGARRATTQGLALAVDGAGSAYVSGTSTSTAYPLTPGALQSGGTTFVTKLNPAGNGLAYSTRFVAPVAALAVHADGTLLLTGTTVALNTTPGAFQPAKAGASSPYVARINPAGTGLVYATYVGGSAMDEAHGIAVDALGNAYVVGTVRSSDFPTRGPLRPALSGSSDAFVAKLNPSGTALIYATYLGGSADERGFGVAVDGAGEATVVGWTTSPDFPVTPGVFQPRIGRVSSGLSNAFISRFDASGAALRWSSYLGGGWCAGSGQSSCFGIFGADEGIDVATSVAVDSAGFTYVGGYATSTLFPLVDPLQGFGPGSDVQRAPFLARIRPGASRLAYSVVLGPRTSTTTVNQLAIDGKGGALAVGISADDWFPLTGGAVLGPGQSFVFKLASGMYPTTLRTSANPAKRAQPLVLVADSDSAAAGGTMTFYDGANVLGTAPVVDGTASLGVTLAPGVHRLTAVNGTDGKVSPPLFQLVSGQ